MATMATELNMYAVALNRSVHSAMLFEKMIYTPRDLSCRDLTWTRPGVGPTRDKKCKLTAWRGI